MGKKKTPLSVGESSLSEWLVMKTISTGAILPSLKHDLGQAGYQRETGFPVIPWRLTQKQADAGRVFRLPGLMYDRRSELIAVYQIYSPPGG